jgi:hypothetical protein
VSLARLTLLETFHGLFEGSLETASYFRREDLPQHVDKILSPGWPLVVLDDGAPALPRYEWIAEFTSRSGVHETDPDFASRLFVCWYSQDLPADLPGFISSTLSQVDWETSAEDFSIIP